MTLTVTKQPQDLDLLLQENAPPLPEHDITPEHLTNYVSFFRQTQDKCDYYIGLGLLKAHDEWAGNTGPSHGNRGGSTGKFVKWVEENKSLVKSNQEAYRLMNWATDLTSQNLGGQTSAIQKLEAGLSQGARTELHKAEPIVQEAIIQHVSQSDEQVKVTAKEIEELTKKIKALEAENKEAKEEAAASNDLAKMLADSEEEKEAAAKAHQAQLDKITKLLEDQKAAADAAKKQAREDRAFAKKLQAEIDSLTKQRHEVVDITPPTADDNAETEGIRKNVVSLYERYVLTAAGDWRQSINRYYEFRDYMTPGSIKMLDKVMKSIFQTLKENMDDEGNCTHNLNKTIDI